MDVFHAAECDTLRGEIDRLRNYAARLVVHNDALLKMTAKQSPSPPDDAFLGQPRGGPAPSLADLPPPWHHPHPPPPRGGATEKLGLQRVIAHKLEDLSVPPRRVRAPRRDTSPRRRGGVARHRSERDASPPARVVEPVATRRGSARRPDARERPPRARGTTQDPPRPTARSAPWRTPFEVSSPHPRPPALASRSSSRWAPS